MSRRSNEAATMTGSVGAAAVLVEVPAGATSAAGAGRGKREILFFIDDLPGRV
jgi:hypothetical protein